MFGKIARKIFGTPNERFVKSLHPQVELINKLEDEIAKLSDDELKAQTVKFQQRLADGEKLDNLLPEAFATVREASKRIMNMRHFDVQLVGGIVLHRGMISEMKTGEGKTLVATLPVYLNALSGKGVHVVTVNDYLARRDSEWMGNIYRFLGLDVGCIVPGISEFERKAAYAADITYGTNNEFGFDYLRDNLKFNLDEMVQRPFNYAIVDEVDSILVDEARTPLIISGQAEDSSELYIKINRIMPELVDEDFEKDEKSRTVTLTEAGVHHIEALLVANNMLLENQSIYDLENIHLVHHVNQALKAHKLFSRDVDYIVKDHRVMIIDEFTGRMMEGRRYSEGLHQALEAKEGVPIQHENQTLASITFQNYFRMYPKLAGMTGTAMTEAAEFADIYNLQVIEIPTHRAVSRKDGDDVVYRTLKEKNDAITELVKECHGRKQPVLVGTVSIEKSEELSALLKKNKIPHQVLNARHNDKEAEIIAQAGRPGSVTIATNMAGRGTDIMLGGNPEMLIKSECASIEDEKKRIAKADAIRIECEQAKQAVIEAGGLYVIGTERHESRRIDNQLRGRSGRQGDPGESKFFLSLQDDLMRIFGSERIDAMLVRLGLKEGEAIFHPWMTKALEKAQQKVEARNFDMRKNLLKFDNVMNDQRKVVYEQRIDLMKAQDISETIKEMQEEVISEMVEMRIPPKSYAAEWDLQGLHSDTYRIFGLDLPIQSWGKEEGVADKEILERITDAVNNMMAEKERLHSSDIMRMIEKRILLTTLDQLWKDHLLALDHLRQGIHLRGYGQKDPLNEYKHEAFAMFESMLGRLREEVISKLALVHITVNDGDEDDDESRQNVINMPRKSQNFKESRENILSDGDEDEDFAQRPKTAQKTRSKPESGRISGDPSTWGRVGRNEACPCGSGEKFKYCHGKLAAV
jgi:preprotein translocase subunit SecA